MKRISAFFFSKPKNINLNNAKFYAKAEELISGQVFQYHVTLFTRAVDTIFVPPLYCCFCSIISMNILENRKDDNFETYDFLWILWISFWVNELPVNNLCFALD